MVRLKLDGICLPAAERRPVSTKIHSQVHIDGYKYLEKLSKKTRSYIETENQYSEAMLGQVKGLQQLLYEEMKISIDLSYDWPMASYGGFDYYYRVTQGQGYEAYYRKNTFGEQLLLDLNEEAKGLPFFVLGELEISPDNKIMGYSVDTKGDECYRIIFKDIESKIVLDQLVNVDSGFVWANDGETVYYLTLDPTMRPYRVYRHKVGAGRSSDQLVYEEIDPQFYLGLSKSVDSKYIFIVCGSHATTEVRYFSADCDDSVSTPVIPRQSGVEYSADHNGQGFFILTNRGKENFQVIRIPHAVEKQGDNETELFKPGEGIFTQSFNLFRDHLIIWESDESSTRIRVKELAGQQGEYLIPLPDRFCRAEVLDDQEFDAPQLRFEYSTPVTPNTIFDWDYGTRTLTQVKVRPIKDYHPELYEVERLYATTEDGEKILITTLSPGNCNEDPHPMYLYGYGAYGDMYYPEFDPNFICLLNRGFSIAIAHIRGGRDRGDIWYKTGKLLNKLNTFKDFIVCAEFLIRGGYTSQEKLAIYGRSAGGLLMGAVTNMRPDLFGAVVAEVPFVDVVSTMLNPDLPLTVIEYEEWGNPNDAEYFDYMMTYSPYDNVSAQNYPPMFVTGGVNDSRVSYHEPLKWVAKLRALKTDTNPLLLQMKDEGHRRSDNKYETIKDLSEKFAFILSVLK